jgi:hypothetical protein
MFSDHVKRECERIIKKTAFLTVEDSLQLAAGNLQFENAIVGSLITFMKHRVTCIGENIRAKIYRFVSFLTPPLAIDDLVETA